MLRLVTNTNRLHRMEAVGLNRNFGHREDEPIRHESNIEEQLQRATKPDAVYGLRQSRNIENLLNDTACVGRPEDGQDMLVHELLGESPLSEEGDPIVFPFPVLEAKSAKSADSDWNSVRLQSAFPVRTLLCTQMLLRNVAEPHSKRKAGPLVWLLMNKGEDWRVSVATVQNDADEKAGMVGTTEYVRFPLDFSSYKRVSRIRMELANVHSKSLICGEALLRLKWGIAAFANCGLCVRMGS